MKLISFLIVNLVFLSACGGGGSSSPTPVKPPVNLPPVANNDSYEFFANTSRELDVLVNDSDNEALNISNISSPENGSVFINSNMITYTPNISYIGSDSFTYTLTDSVGQQSSAEVSLSILSVVKLQGRLIGYEQAGLEVVVKAGSFETTTTTDSNGSYTINIGLHEEDALVVATVENAAPNYTMHAYLGDISGLTALMDEESFIATNQNITDLTTAEYELIDLVLNGNEASTLNELTAAQFEADNFYQLQMTVASQLINQDNGLELADEFTTVNEFIKSTTSLGKQLASWREYNADLYHQAYASLSANNDLTSFPERLTIGKHFLTESAASYGDNYGLGYLNYLTLENSQGSYMSREDDALGMSWLTSSNSLIVNLNETTTSLSFRQNAHCASRDSTRAFYFHMIGFELTQLYSTKEYDVYLQKINIERETSSDCFSNETALYNTIRHYHSQPIVIDNENVLLNKVVVDNLGEVDQAAYSRIADLTLADDGSFIDNAEENNTLTGTWLNQNNILVLNYSDGMSFWYQKVTDYHGVARLIYTYFKGEQLLGTSVSYITSESEVNWPYHAGQFSWDISPIFDPELNREMRWNLTADKLGAYQKYTNGTWDDTGVISTWSREGSTYYVDIYFDEDAGYVNYCDVSLDNCYLYVNYTWKVIGETHGVYKYKYYSKIYNSQGEEISSINFVSLTKFTPE